MLAGDHVRALFVAPCDESLVTAAAQAVARVAAGDDLAVPGLAACRVEQGATFERGVNADEVAVEVGEVSITAVRTVGINGSIGVATRRVTVSVALLDITSQHGGCDEGKAGEGHHNYS